MSNREDLEVQASPEGSDEEAFPQQYFNEQAEYFDNMKQFLLSQQELLRRNLDNVRDKAEKPLLATKQTTGSEKLEPPKQSTPPHSPSPVSTQTNGTSKEPSSVAFQPKHKDEIQICPVCGMEFDVEDPPELLETHVAEHWCPTENE